MSMLDKFRKGAAKAGIQASAFLKEGGNKIANESQHFVQGFSLPGEAEKAAKILESFLGASAVLSHRNDLMTTGVPAADPEHPESALNAIPKAVLQRARGKFICSLPQIPPIHRSPTQASPSSPS